jgi:hypothetical protein
LPPYKSASETANPYRPPSTLPISAKSSFESERVKVDAKASGGFSQGDPYRPFQEPAHIYKGYVFLSLPLRTYEPESSQASMLRTLIITVVIYFPVNQ